MSFSRFGVTLTALLAIASLQAVNSDDKEPLYQAKPITAKDSFTGGIEGPACDTQGNVFAVNFARQGTIGKVTPKGEASLFIELPEGSVGNGIRFDQSGNMYIADYPQHNVLRVDAKTGKLTVFAHNDKMNQPNDLAIMDNGILRNFFVKILSKKYMYTIFFIIFCFGWNPKTSLTGDIGTNPLWKIPYNASKRIIGFDSFRLFQESTIIKWHKKYVE